MLQKLVRISRPFQLLLVLLPYGLGLSVARYLGITLRPESQFLGGFFILFVTIASAWLEEYFRPVNEPIIPGETRAEREQLRALLLNLSLAMLGVALMLAILLHFLVSLPITSLLFLGAFLLFSLARVIPPVRLLNLGYGEFTLAVLQAGMAPSIAFLLQDGELHRIINLLSLPLFLMALSSQLALAFPAYAEDMKYERRSLATQLGWDRAMLIHNGLLAVSYLLIAAQPFFGLPVVLLWPAMLTLPLSIYQVFMLRRISEGATPVWPALTSNAIAIFAFTTYLLTLTFWLR